MNVFVMVGLVFGAVSSAIHAAICYRSGRKISIGPALEILIYALSASGGIKIIRCAISPSFVHVVTEMPSMSSDDAAYFAIGGLALSWISIQSIWNRLRSASVSVKYTEPD
jgi:hypothetical protein